jgi:hypothetical protein
MKTAHMYVGGSVLVALLGIGLVVYLVRRKPVINVSGVITAGEPSITYHSDWTPKDSPESDVARMIRISDAAIAADDAEAN